MLRPRTLIPGLLLAITSIAIAQSQPETTSAAPEQYSATAVISGGGAPGKSVGVTIFINSYTTNEEVPNYINILKANGQDGIAAAFDNTKGRGRIAIEGAAGNDISFIRQRTVDHMRVVRMATNRNISFPDLTPSPRSRDYKFGIVELHLDQNGNGDGTIMYAAKVKFNKKNDLIIQHYGETTIHLTNVRRQK